MRPKQPEAEPQDDLFRARLENLVDPRHALARLAGLIDWGRFEAEFGALYTDGGRPGLPTRLMVGLHLLKHMDGLSDEAVCAAGEQLLEHGPAADPIPQPLEQQRAADAARGQAQPFGIPLEGGEQHDLVAETGAGGEQGGQRAGGGERVGAAESGNDVLAVSAVLPTSSAHWKSPASASACRI